MFNMQILYKNKDTYFWVLKCRVYFHYISHFCIFELLDFWIILLLDITISHLWILNFWILVFSLLSKNLKNTFENILSHFLVSRLSPQQGTVRHTDADQPSFSDLSKINPVVSSLLCISSWMNPTRASNQFN